MFFNRKKRIAKKHIEMTNYVKILLVNKYWPILHPVLIVKGKPPLVAEKEAKTYAAYTVNKLFGDPNSKLTIDNEHFFIQMDYHFQGMFGAYINGSLPHLKRLITDAVLRYRAAFEALNQSHLLENKEVVNSNFLRLNLMPENYIPLSDDEFTEIATRELQK